MKNEDQKTLFAKRLSIAMQAKGYQPKAAVLEKASLYTTNFIEPLSYQAFSFLKLRALS